MAEMTAAQLTAAFKNITTELSTMRDELRTIMPEVVNQIKATKQELDTTLTSRRESVEPVVKDHPIITQEITKNTKGLADTIPRHKDHVDPMIDKFPPTQNQHSGRIRPGHAHAGTTIDK